jgi:PAS domain-containing protein
MSIAELLPLFGTFLAALLSAALIVTGLGRLLRRGAAPAGQAPAGDDAVFLFQDGLLTDATPAARRMIAAIRSDCPSLTVVAGHLARRFPGLRERLHGAEKGVITGNGGIVAGRDGRERAHVETGHGHVRLVIDQLGTTGPLPEQSSLTALEQEVHVLRSLAEDAPQLIWQQDDSGTLTWANRAYLALADRLAPRGHGDDPVWPVRPLLPTVGPLTGEGTTMVTRAQVALPGLAEPQTYEVTSIRRGEATVHFAVDASNIIAAEQGRQKFVQTLTRTFAHLTAGLAIFDRDRRLVLFNPAFLDLTTLPAIFLSQRPSVSEVLDRLRDLRMLPEPKDYTGWRDRVAALEAAAVRGTYTETWSLPSGRTYRVSGRPHPDGAIAFLFEDISDEILLTRHFRSELVTAQAVLDSLDEAVAVFSTAGTMTMSNAAYASLWGQEADSMGEHSLDTEVTTWQGLSQPSPVWDHLRASAADLRDRSRWQDAVRTRDGRSLICRFQPLAGGASLVAFRPQIAKAPRLEKITDLIPAAAAGATRRAGPRPRAIARN